MEQGGSGFVRADKIDLKSLDKQLERHLSRAWTMEKKKKEERERQMILGEGMENWEIDPNKLIVKGMIARGTFGTVHRGIYDGEQVAVKLLDWGDEGTRTDAEISSLRLAFTKEVAVWHKLDHPNVTKFIGAIVSSGEKTIRVEDSQLGMPNNACCLVVEYLPGGTLKSFLVKNGKKKLALKIVLQFALDIARGLSYIHSKRMVHRDVKTENMLLDKNRAVKIADFGVARFEAKNPNEMTGETGTIGYMAPEVLTDNSYNRKCDVYSFGICLWEIYCCDMPNLIVQDIKTAIQNKDWRPEIPKCCPSSLGDLMRRCWDGNPARRPEMKDVVTSLEKIDASRGGGMTPSEEQPGCICFGRSRAS